MVAIDCHQCGTEVPPFRRHCPRCRTRRPDLGGASRSGSRPGAAPGENEAPARRRVRRRLPKCRYCEALLEPKHLRCPGCGGLHPRVRRMSKRLLTALALIPVILVAFMVYQKIVSNFVNDHAEYWGAPVD